MKRLYFAFIMLMIALFPASVKASAETIPHLTYNGHEYWVSDNRATYADAEAYCKQKGGHLAIITSAAENKAITNYICKYYPDEQLMIGLYDEAGSDGSWSTWVDGTPVTYKNWGSAQPDWSGQTICCINSFASTTYGWDIGEWDNNYDGNSRFILERPIPPKTVKKDVEKKLKKIGDKDLPDSEYELLQAKITKTTDKKLLLEWKKISKADGYIIYGNKCGKSNKYEYITTLKSRNITKYKLSGLKPGTYYKYFVVAYKNAGSNQNVITVSKTVHSITKKGKYGNSKSVIITKLGKQTTNTNKLTLKKKKSVKITAYTVLVNKKLPVRKHRGLAYESSNPKVASVSSKGVIKGLKAGSAKIYVYAQNGVASVIDVTVK